MVRGVNDRRKRRASEADGTPDSKKKQLCNCKCECHNNNNNNNNNNNMNIEEVVVNKPKPKPKPFGFFKLVLPAILSYNSLRLPEKFANKYGPHLSTNAILKIPTGVCWNVVVSRLRHNKLHFSGQGWVSFMEHNNIKSDYFLEFEYEGDSHFTVYIFDNSCSEIHYPCPLKCNHHHHHLKAKGAGQDDIHTHSAAAEAEVETMLDNEDNNPCFTITVRRYHVAATNPYFYIPRSFANKYMKGRWCKFVKLSVNNNNNSTSSGSGGRGWYLRCSYINDGIRLIGLGWKKFKQHNNWIEGQIYTFVMVNRKHNLVEFKVIRN